MKKIQEKIFQATNDPGIYLFYDKTGKIIYVGKATSLKSRLRSYFYGQRSSRPIEEMLDRVERVDYLETDSVLEAVIKEADYIKKYQPKYNVLGKDDKSWNYIVISKDNYPQVFFIREHELRRLSKSQLKKYSHIFGPYPGLNTKAAMKILSRLFNISVCRPGRRRPCLYYEMGQCLGVCVGEISPAEYKTKVIRPLVMFLKGNKKRLITELQNKMKSKADQLNFEEAGRLRNQINALRRIHDIAILNRDFFAEFTQDNESIYGTRIEGYDISNLGSSGKVGSMVVFSHGEPLKSQYRRFKIKTVQGQSDVDCLEEVLVRRFRHREWKPPALVLVDGGKAQVNRAKKVLLQYGVETPVVGITKGPTRKRNDVVLGSGKGDFVRWVDQNKQILISVRDEAHRFAINYQRKLRKIGTKNK